MIEINLVPGGGKRKAARGPAFDWAGVRTRVSRTGDPFVIGAVAVCLVTFGAVGWLYFSQGQARTASLDRLDKALTDSTHYSTVLVDRRQAEARRDSALWQLNLIRTIDDDRYIWAHVMDEVSRALPQYTWLTSLTFTGTPQGTTNAAVLPAAAKADTGKKAKPPKRLDTNIPKDAVTVRLMGRTVDIEALTLFMRQLAASPYFSNVQLDQSQIASDQGKEVTQFQLTMAFTRPDSMVVHRVPLMVSGR